MKRLKVIAKAGNVISVAFQPMCRCGDITGQPHRCFFQEAMDRHPAGKQR